MNWCGHFNLVSTLVLKNKGFFFFVFCFCPEDWHLLAEIRHFLCPWVPFCWCRGEVGGGCRGEVKGKPTHWSMYIHPMAVGGTWSLCRSAQGQAEACLEVYQVFHGSSILQGSREEFWSSFVIRKWLVWDLLPLPLLISLFSMSFVLPWQKAAQHLHILTSGMEWKRFFLYREVCFTQSCLWLGRLPLTDLDHNVLAPSQEGWP